MENGLVEVYTGNGKGKTTAALGLAVRAIGRGYRVLFFQFMKSGDFGEHLGAKPLYPNLQFQQAGMPFFIIKKRELTEERRKALGNAIIFEDGNPPQTYLKAIENGLNKVEKEIFSGNWDVIILDEINVAIHMGLVDKNRILDLIKKKPGSVELVLTGRYADPDIIDSADLVTEMREIKHPFRKGIHGRKGIEFRWTGRDLNP